jgi:tetratricopeptide (TPR) repeat protein
MRAKPRLLAFIERFITAIVVVASPVSMAAKGDSELADAAARIQYAYFTADARSLTEVLHTLEAMEFEGGLQPLQQYQLAYGYWRLLQVQDSSERKIATSPSAATCARHAQAATKLDARFAEAYALDAICSAPPPSTRRTPPRAAKPSANACAHHKSLRKAQELRPNNPRIQLIALSCESSVNAAGEAAAVTALKSIVAGFGTATAARPGAPDWGEPEALVMLGERYLQRGDSMAARDALERALVLAPDYRYAQVLLQQAAARQR